MEQYISKAAVAAEIERRISNHNKELRHASNEDFVSSWASDEENQKLALVALIPFIDTLEVKEVDEEYNGKAMLHVLEKGVEQGKREILNNLWKSADGDDLPEIDREVIALLSNGKVVYAHRPKEYWNGKNIATGEVTRYYPVRYDKDGWNQPNVKWWLDLELPKMEE